MTPLIIVGLIFGGALVLLLLWGVVMYNGLVTGRNVVKNGWAQIDVQLKRRHDLVPNLVETVRGYATHERQTLENVTAARSRALGATDVGDRIKAENALGGALRGLMISLEAYPDLKANANFLSLQEELTSTENKIGFARQFYNDQVMHYNTKLEMFPTNMVAGAFQFKPAAPFELTDEQQREAPKVKF